MLVIEIRPGVGGADASLFVSDLMRMYLRYAEKRGWTIDHVNEGCLRLSGDGVEAMLGEAGTHCIQRIPSGAKGHVHTSIATVAVIPEPDSTFRLSESDIKFDTMRAGGHGGQGVNKTESGVRAIHIPTGETVVIKDERSQHQNKARAISILRARLYDRHQRGINGSIHETRSEQIKTGSRAERMRTYDIPEDLVADRRLSKKVKGVKKVLNGDLDRLWN